MSAENLNEIIPIVDGLANNKAAVFSYTEQAYQDNDVNGVSQYDFSKEQNIPDRNSTDTNAQVLTKGFRSQGASIPRNFLNHFIGRFSYNLNKLVDMFKSFLASYKTDYRKNGFMYDATLQYQVGDVCMDVWTDNTFAFFIRTGNGGSAGVRPMKADGENWTTNEHWLCIGSYAKTAQSFALRDKTGKIQVADPTDDLDAANKNYVDTKSTGDAGAVQQALNAHIAATTGVHGAVSTATANKIAIRDASGRLQVATPSAANDAVNKSYFDTALGKLGTLIEKRVIKTTGNVSIPAGTKLITYIGIGGGGGGGSAGKGFGVMIKGGNGGGGGSGAAGDATPGNFGGPSNGTGTGAPGTKGGNGGKGESGIIWNVKSLKITAHIGTGGSPGTASTTAGADGGDTYVTTESTEELVTHIKNVSPNKVNGTEGLSGAQGGKGGPAVVIFEFDEKAGQGGNGGIGNASMNPQPGTAGKDGAIIMFFYK